MAISGHGNSTNPGGPVGGERPKPLPPTYYLNKKYQFIPFYYPFSDLLIQQFNRNGIDGVLRPDGNSLGDKAMTLQKGSTDFSFSSIYNPSGASVMQPYPKEDFDFSFGGAYSDYNWELFFHNPVMAAEKLSQNQKFKDAQTWFHYVFDPTISFVPEDYPELFDPYFTDYTGLTAEEQAQRTQEKEDRIVELKRRRFWRLKPFYEFSSGTNIERLLAELKSGSSNEDRQRLEKEINVWRENPFMPHRIAQIRVASYMKYIVMKYLDNLIAWADSLFRQDTLESINEATQLYLLASSILGDKPTGISRKDAETKSYNDLVDNFDDFSNALIQLENGIVGAPVARGSNNAAQNNGVATINALFFCIPSNKKMEEYWDTIADRLFKIRNCQNIDGVERQLALFAPVIDPLALVIAAGRGGSFQAALRDLNMPLPNYRFNYMIQRALELCNDVKSLGGALLSALEKKDSENIAILRSQHEVKVLDNLRYAKQLAIEESNQAIETLVQSKDNINHRLNYYVSREYMNAEEKQQMENLKKAMEMNLSSARQELLVGVLEALPNISFGMNGTVSSPHFATMLTSQTAAALISANLRMNRAMAQREQSKASRASIKAGHQRRKEDWDFQAETARIELKQIDKQIEGAYHRRQIAIYELELNERQAQNATEIADVMETKYTNKELYSWMVSELSKLYFKSYQMALDIAKTAEKCFQFERPENYKLPFISPYNWNSLKKGLLAGDYLNENLRRMQQAYDKANERRLELKKNVSLAIIDPEAVISLRNTGFCTFNLPEIIFDLDFPGHYNRRIKSVSLSIPCILGPNGNLPAKLSLTNNKVRYVKESQNYTQDENNFKIGRTGTQSIATSTANRDSGLFELNFNDSRYLPFEGAGVISTWTLELPDASIAQFDYNSISDVIIHVDYEAEEAGNRDAVTSAIQTTMSEVIDTIPEGWSTMISLKQQFASDLISLFDGETASFGISSKHFPYLFQDKTRTIKAIDFTLIPKKGESLSAPISLLLNDTTTSSADEEINFAKEGNVWEHIYDDSTGPFGLDSETLTITKSGTGDAQLVSGKIDDILMVVHFDADVPSPS